MRIKAFPTTVFVLCMLFNGISAQECTPPPIQFNTKTENIFTAQQEMYLGETILEKVQSNYGVIDDEALNAFLQRMGDRLRRHLPETGINFRFMIADVPDTNAYSFPGGIIMVTRKLVNFVRSEDELAGVLAHELGHSTVRHGGLDWSRYFKTLLKTSTVGDRQDVFEKYNQVIDLWNTKEIRSNSGHEDNQQIEADKLGMFALVAAGYDGSQFPQFWVRMTKAKKRSGLSTLFGTSRPADKRLKEMLDQFRSLPETCREQKAGTTSKEFNDWRTSVVTYNNAVKTESLPGLIMSKEIVPLRTEIDHLRFSRNGEYILSQDSSTVTVLTRDPFKVLFQVPATEARPAEFSGDSKELVIVNSNLHVQKWSISDKKLVSEHEVSITEPFWQTRVSPNGDVIAAYHYNGDLALYDVRSGEEIFREKRFYDPGQFQAYVWRLMMSFSVDGELPIMSMNFSPDNRYFLASRDLSPRYDEGSYGGIRIYFIGTAPSGSGRDRFLGINVPERKTIAVGENIKKMVRIGFGFISDDRMIGRVGEDIKKSGIFSFPGGERLDQFELGGTSFNMSGSGDNIVVRPVIGAAVGVFDLKQKKYVFAGKKSAMDVNDKFVVAERKNGGLAIYSVGRSDPVATVELPKSEFGTLRTVSFSDDGEWLVASDKSRGAVWRISSGERIFQLRTFRGSYIAPDGKIYVDFPATGDTPRTIATMDPAAVTVTPGSPLKEGNLRQFGRFVIIRRSLKADSGIDDEKIYKKDGDKPFTEEAADKLVGFTKTAMEVRDAQTGGTLWTREFPDETPRHYISDIHKTMSLVWPVRARAAADIIRQRPDLQENVKALKDPSGDMLIQVIDLATGVAKGHLLVETGEGSFRIQNVTVAGDYVVVDDTENRQLVYSLSKGALIRRIFGTRGAIAERSGLIAVENVEGRVTVTEIETGREIGKLLLKTGIAAMQFSVDGKKFLLLTRDQKTYVFDTAKIDSSKSL